jgi:alpha-beta hydrolase superfamily lysophospholipase
MIFAFALLLTQALPLAHAEPTCPPGWKGALGRDDCAMTTFNFRINLGIEKVTARIRNGYMPENPDVPFKGNILYFEGLGDSMANHRPLFEKLTKEGYRVIAFDYQGQGGSRKGASMNNTRIEHIWRMGNIVYDKYARDKDDPKLGKRRKVILGWSTGGLAAYDAAAKNQASAIIQIAPGNTPKYDVFWISMSSLTTAAKSYDCGASNPHVDPIWPRSPAQAPFFSGDLIKKGIQSRDQKIPAHIPGLVLLSDPKDKYVYEDKTRELIDRNAPHFEKKTYPGALHEIDNESDGNALRAHEDILAFLRKL